MSMTQLRIGYRMTLKELARSRVVMVLLFAIPAVLFSVTWLTTPRRKVPFKLAAIGEDKLVTVGQLHEALVFIGLAAVGLLAAFLSFSLIQKSFAASCRLTLCGFRSSRLALAKLLAQLTVIGLLGVYITLYLRACFAPRHIASLLVGLALMGFVYGCYGLLIGTLVKRELEGILLIALLCNLDVGWLQNPLFYADAHHKAVIRYLPAFYPSQTAMASAFSDFAIATPLRGSLLYGCLFLLAALLVYHLRMPRRAGPSDAPARPS